MVIPIQGDPQSFSLAQIEAAVLAIPLERFTAALRFGISEEHGCRLAREQMSRT
jgi:hypothetical protein